MVQTKTRTVPNTIREIVRPVQHAGFAARALLCKEEGSPADCCLAVIAPGSGGPSPSHTHSHDHIFFVLEGVARIEIDTEVFTVTANQAIHVPGLSLHSLWNRGEEELRLLSMNI